MLIAPVRISQLATVLSHPKHLLYVAWDRRASGILHATAASLTGSVKLARASARRPFGALTHQGQRRIRGASAARRTPFRPWRHITQPSHDVRLRSHRDAIPRKSDCCGPAPLPALPSAPTPPAPVRGSDYAELSRQVKQAGLLQRRRWRYISRITVTATLLAAGWAVFVLVGDSWWQLAVAAFLAVMFTQVGFLGHDAGHRQISGSRRVSYILGILHGNLGIGLSYGWWVDKHSRHHAHPNTEGADPDITMSVLAFTATQESSACLSRQGESLALIVPDSLPPGVRRACQWSHRPGDHWPAVRSRRR
jgi:hypothetical protein